MVQSIDEVRRRQQATRQGPSGRVPPHNLQAEESLLGAMLLSREAIADAVEICHADDFYKPAHSHVFEAIQSLYAQGEPVDLVTVAEELRRADLLEAIGGPTLLLTLQGSTPATSNAARYARIVEEHALLRRLIGVAGEIAELGYSLPDDVESAVDRAETMMFEVAQHRTADTMAPLRSLIDQSLDRLEQLYERNEAITGTPTGFLDLDELTSGLQPSALVIVGARPGMGKALALDTAIPTPEGWTTMGELAPGDLVIDEQGHPCRVTYTSPIFVGNRCFEIHFDDGTTIVADADHRWSAYDHPGWTSHLDRATGSSVSPRVVTTQQMVDEGVRASTGGAPNWYIPVAALDLAEQGLPLDPYDVGHALAEIPSLYLRASWKQRLELLQGVMDAAGALTTSGVEVCLADRQLAERVWELVCSLGHKAHPIRQKPCRQADGRVADSFAFAWTPLDPVFRQPQNADELARRARLSHVSEATRRAVVDIVEVPSVPTRCIAVDSPNHLFLAGRSMVTTHNTSFGLGIAAHAGMVERRPVLFFSLEMSHLELTSRLLCAEAKVDSSRLRNGKLLDADWEKIHRAIGSLAEAPIYIDDNPNTTIMEIRSKARRLKAREGDLGLIVVDYLQLMTGRSSAESRQVEVAEMSRGLKILARELHTPVVALSQLSRNLESRGDKRPMLADLRESGCLTADARVLRADTGAETTFGALMLSGERNIPVWSLDTELRVVPAVMTEVFPTGVKPVFELRLSSGRVLKASANHPFLTVDGWARLDELRPGSRIATPRRVPEPLETRSMPVAEIVMLAHLLGDGCVAPRQPVHYTSADPACLAAVSEAAAHFGITPRRVDQGRWSHVYLPSPQRLTHGRRNPIQAWLAQWGLDGKRSYEKYIPDSVYSLPRPELALFLRHLWATDGSLGLYKNRDSNRPTIYYATTSRRLADGVQRLLERFAIIASVNEVSEPRGRTGYQVVVRGSRSMRIFLEEIGVFGERAARIDAILERIDGCSKDAYSDALPLELNDEIAGVLARNGMSARSVATSAGLGNFQLLRSPITRSRLAAVAEVLENDRMRWLSSEDVHWDRVISITPCGEEPVFDATVAETHNFIANGVCVENSLEQDADVVMFLYRDEIYNPDSADKGIAEVIVAKHRNGPTGITNLAFLDRYTRFANMARV